MTEITPNTATVDLEDLRALETASNEPLVIGRDNPAAVHAVMVPNGYRIEDLAPLVRKQLPHPARPIGTLNLDTEASFVEYVGRFSPDYAQTTIRLHRNGGPDSLGQAHAVFDDHIPGDGTRAGWQEFGAAWSLALAPEYLRWKEKSGEVMTQADFARFLEENIGDIEDGAALLGIAMSMQAKTNTEAKSAVRLDNGQVQFAYVESIDAKAGAAGNITIPATFTVNLRVLRGAKAGYRLQAKLRWRIGSGALRLWFDLDRLSDLEDIVRDEVAERLAKATKLPVLRTA